MKSILLTAFAVLLATCIARPAQSDEPAPPVPQPAYGVEGKSLFQEDFTSGKLDEAWQIMKGHWEVKDGALVGAQVPEQNHAAVLRREIALHDFIAEFNFKFDGGKATKLVINKNASHIATVSIWTGEITIDTRPEKDPGKKVTRLDSQTLKLSPESSHRVVIEVVGNLIVATVDGRFLLFGQDDGLDIDKTSFDFAANGSTAIQSMRITQAAPPADPDAARRKLQTLRPAK